MAFFDKRSKALFAVYMRTHHMFLFVCTYMVIMHTYVLYGMVKKP